MRKAILGMDATEEIKQLKSAGMSYDRIAEKFGVSQTAIQRIFSDENSPASGECAKCGSADDLVSHHYDYQSKKFVLCRKCHARIHTQKSNEFWIGYENLPEGYHRGNAAHKKTATSEETSTPKVLKMSPELFRDSLKAARKSHRSLTQWIRDAMQEKLAREAQTQEPKP